MTGQETDPVAITQVLKEVECDEESIRKFLNLVEKHRIQESISLLNKQREALCNARHVAQKKIDCLDYLVYKMEQEND